MDPSSSSPSNDGEDPFVHQIAIKLSRALNIINPNDLLAKRVIEIAKSNSEPHFVKGELTFEDLVVRTSVIRSSLASSWF